MDVRSRFQNFDEVLQTLADTVQARIFTVMPVKATKASGDGHTVQIQPTIKAVQRMPDGSEKVLEYPEVLDAPVHAHGAGGYTNTMPIGEGDEGLGIVSCRPVDTWHQQGGTQPQLDARMHDLSDMHFIPGLRSDPKKLKNVSKSSAQTRTDDHETVSDWSKSAVTHARGVSVQTFTDTGITTNRKDSTHVVDDNAVTSAKGSSKHAVGPQSIDNISGKILLNC
jgi:hypothetical protein